MEDDLNPDKSTKHLTTLKRVYLKILHLVEKGVVFVGHALNNDFSVLNIHVRAFFYYYVSLFYEKHNFPFTKNILVTYKMLGIEKKLASMFLSLFLVRHSEVSIGLENSNF